MPRLSLAKLERHLYAAADRLRQEGLDAATYKDYIFGMLFLKRCSYVFEAENASILHLLLPVSTLSGPPTTYTFPRMANPDLQYELVAGETAGDWSAPPFWTSTGVQNIAGTVTVEDPVDPASVPARFLLLRIRSP
jgi:hypothetical protein